MEIISRRLCVNILKVRTNLRTIMTSTRRMEKVQEELKKNPYFEKYAGKIAQLQQTSPEEFLERAERFGKSKEKKPEGKGAEQFSSLLKPKKELGRKEEVKDEPLEKIMKVELVRDKTAEEVKQIWQEYHIQKDVISATIPKADYDAIMAQASKYPTFLFPLPRSQGYEFIMVQFQRNSVHFTPLICFQVHKENAPECLTITHYTEFKENKGIVLMRGEYDKNVIDAREAQCLANLLQMYYGGKDPEKTKLLEEFTTRPDAFKHMDLIKQLENFKLE